MKTAFMGYLLTSVLLLSAGCASNTERQPTHYWDAATKSESKYSADNASCEAANGAEASNPMLAEDGAFQAYKECMLSRGYVLRTY
jgi:hypothetical protein